MTTSNTEQQIEKLVAILEDYKAENIQIIDVKAKSTITEYFIIATGTSQKHCKAIADHLVEEAKIQKIENYGFEGQVEADWIAIDFGSVFAHIMQEEAREIYSLDKLWASTQRASK